MCGAIPSAVAVSHVMYTAYDAILSVVAVRPVQSICDAISSAHIYAHVLVTMPLVMGSINGFTFNIKRGIWQS